MKKTLKLDVEEVDIHEIIDVLCDGFELKIQQLNSVLHQNLAAKNSVVKGDAFHLTNLLSNLLGNAIKYSKETLAKLRKYLAKDTYYTIETENLHDKGFILKMN